MYMVKWYESYNSCLSIYRKRIDQSLDDCQMINKNDRWVESYWKKNDFYLQNKLREVAPPLHIEILISKLH